MTSCKTGLFMDLAESHTTGQLLTAIEQGEELAIDRLLALHRNYLKRIIDVRLDLHLRGRVDPSDVVQETLVVVSRQIGDFLKRRPTSFRIWLRRKALDQLFDQRRFHYRQKRDVAQEISLNDHSSMAIAVALMGDSPSHLAMRQELLQRVREAMESLPETDREVLLLRHAEELSNTEAAEVMGVDPKTAGARYGRAVLRLSAELRRQGIREA